MNDPDGGRLDKPPTRFSIPWCVFARGRILARSRFVLQQELLHGEAAPKPVWSENSADVALVMIVGQLVWLLSLLSGPETAATELLSLPKTQSALEFEG